MNAVPVLRSVAAFLCLSMLVVTGRGAQKVSASRGEITLPTYPWSAVKHPYFRGTDKVNIYPYPMLDFLSREKTNRTYKTVLLENEYLKITFLPELGGKIQEVTDKTTGKPMFYVNHVIKPGLIGQCGAWTSGGVEWNTGPQGHTVSAMQPVSVEILPQGKDGSQAVAIGETERIFGTRWTVVVTLRPGRSYIEERIRIYNPTETVRPYYFWNCTAMPNTPGFRFIYPMTLGCDHGAEKFFQWPIDNGKDLTRGTNYYDASSIFAWHCDQDFFGSYDDNADRGVVSYANHHQLPGKKAWTWGQGGFGKMHQMDLTDADGPYNEVQTGPLLTQGEVGRLDPCEAVAWDEWWYPIHGIGGFSYANKNVAVNAIQKGKTVDLLIAGTGTWKGVETVLLINGRETRANSARVDLAPARPAILTMGVTEPLSPSYRVTVTLNHRGSVLASFELPLNLPEQKRPDKRPTPAAASEFANQGWVDFLFARFAEAETSFRKALEKDAGSVRASTGLAYLRLDSDPAKAAPFAMQALSVDPDCGLARFALAVAESRTGAEAQALENAWKASLDPATAVAGRALVGKLLVSQKRYAEAEQALSGPGPWETDPLCRDRLALALHQLGRGAEAAEIARQTIQQEPLDCLARSVLWLQGAESKHLRLEDLIKRNRLVLSDLLADYSEPALQQPEVKAELRRQFLRNISAYNAVGEAEFPYRLELIPELKRTLETNPKDGLTALRLGHLLFHAGRFAEGKSMWQRAADAGAEPVVAYRALGMASLNSDNDPISARKFLEKAHELDRTDAIVSRDLAKVLFGLADKSDSRQVQNELLVAARNTLKTAFESGKARSDYVALLGRAYNRLGEFQQAARMLDVVRVTVWEGSHEVHDLFEEAHLELGKQHLAEGRASEALREFNRALEYPENLATGKLENAREAHINYLRGNTFSLLGEREEAVKAWKLAASEEKSSESKKEEARQKARQALERLN